MVLRHTTSSACLFYFLLPPSHLRLLKLPSTTATTQDFSILIPLSICSFSSQMQVMEVSENPKPLMREYRRLMNTAQGSDQFPAYAEQVSGSYPGAVGEPPKPTRKTSRSEKKRKQAQGSDQIPAYPGQVSGPYPAVTGEFPEPENKKRKGSPQLTGNLFDYIDGQSPPPCISI